MCDWRGIFVFFLLNLGVLGYVEEIVVIVVGGYVECWFWMFCCVNGGGLEVGLVFERDVRFGELFWYRVCVELFFVFCLNVFWGVVGLVCVDFV